MDRENANFAGTLQQVQSTLSKRCVPVHLPIGSQESFAGIVDLIEMKAYMGDKATRGRPARGHGRRDRSRRATQLLEVVAETTRPALKYLEGEELTPEEMRMGLEMGIAAGDLVPVLVGFGVEDASACRAFLDAVARYFPSPADRTVKAKDAPAPRSSSRPTRTARWRRRCSRPRPTPTSASSPTCACSRAR